MDEVTEQSRSDFSLFLRNIREGRGLTQQELADKTGISKSQICHIEKSNRGASRRLLSNLIKELRPTLKELERLRSICESENIGIDLPPILVGPNSPGAEVVSQQVFCEVHVVANEPIEISELNERNTFLADFAKQIASKSSEQRKYIYWTSKNSLPRFSTFFSYLEKKHNISRDVVDDLFEVVECPPELLLLGFAIYSTPMTTVRGVGDEYERVGRILIRNGRLAESFGIIKMGEADLDRVYKFLRSILDELEVNDGASGSYRKYSPDEIRSRFGSHSGEKQ